MNTTTTPVKKTTKIEWTDHTINFWWGCTKVSPACTHCYAESWAAFTSKKLFGERIKWGNQHERGQRLEKARAEALRLNRRAEKTGVRMRVFVNSMSDWLDDRVPVEWLTFLLETIFMCPWLDFQLLTKRPENWKQRMLQVAGGDLGELAEDDSLPEACIARSVFDWIRGYPPTNVWIGTTVESQEWAEKRLWHLLRIPANVRFLSVEPMLSGLNVFNEGGILDKLDQQGLLDDLPFNRVNPFLIHWVIAGGESGDHARPSHPDWFRSLRDQCVTAGVPFLFKQWGEWMPGGVDLPCTEREPQTCIKASGELSWWSGNEDTTTNYSENYAESDCPIVRLGKENTGRLLDGQEWSQFPA